MAVLPSFALVCAMFVTTFVGCRKPAPAPGPSSGHSPAGIDGPSPSAAAPTASASTASAPRCKSDAECGAGLVCFRRACQRPLSCDACPPGTYCDSRVSWCQSCPDPADGPISRDFEFEGLRYHVDAKRNSAGDGAWLPAVEITVRATDGQRHGVHRASAFTHGSHTRRGWGALGVSSPRDGVPDTCLGSSDEVRLTFDLSGRHAEVHANEKLEVTYGVLTGDCSKVRARVHVVTVQLDWSCKTPAFWISDGPEKPAAALENRQQRTLGRATHLRS
ncbi:MAG: hypothetical protein JST00_32565 [Deltaproteobacteria bacterium]|nr:hypothetical protein [Deltaproteobacteria bacterium]